MSKLMILSAVPRPFKRRLAPGAWLICFAGVTASLSQAQQAPAAAHVDGAAAYTISCAVEEEDKSVPGVHRCADIESAQRCMHPADFLSRRLL